jgi:hypothetical protein
MNKPICVRFPLYIDKKRRKHYRVFIFRDKELMLEFWQAQTDQKSGINPSGNTEPYEAQCTGWKSELRNGKKTNCVGQILFHANMLGTAIVSHEATHAAHYYLSQRWPDGYHTPYRDEKLAWTQGYLVWQFWRHYYGVAGKRLETIKAYSP